MVSIFDKVLQLTTLFFIIKIKINFQTKKYRYNPFNSVFYKVIVKFDKLYTKESNNGYKEIFDNYCFINVSANGVIIRR